MSKLSDEVNIGKVLESQLEEVGIDTIERLRETGSKEAWLRIRKIDESACIHRLYAIEGAIEGIRKSELSEEMKDDLKRFVKERK